MGLRRTQISRIFEAAQTGDSRRAARCHNQRMLMMLSTHRADIVDAVAPSVVQVRARGRAASGLVYGPDLVLTTGRVIGRDEHPEVTLADDRALAAEIAGWDPANRLVLIRAPGLEAPALSPGAAPRVGNLALALGRSWSNAITATTGTVAIVGGPLATGRRRQIERVIRTSAPMHDGFAGGALVGADGALLGIATAASIRGLGVVIPADIAWTSAAGMLERGSLKRGYLGVAAQPVRVPEKQRSSDVKTEALLVVGVKDGSPAADAGLLLGDVLVSFDGVALRSPEDLLDLLIGDRVGRPVTLRVVRGGSAVDVSVTAAERR
jgi:S1-C subfamily serine protease